MFFWAKYIDRAFRLVPEGRACFPSFGFGRGYVLDAPVEVRLRRFLLWWWPLGLVVAVALIAGVLYGFGAFWDGFPGKYWKLLPFTYFPLYLFVDTLGIRIWLRTVPHDAVRMSYTDTVTWQTPAGVDWDQIILVYGGVSIFTIAASFGVYESWGGDLSWLIIWILQLAASIGVLMMTLINAFIFRRAQPRMRAAKAGGHGAP